MNPIEAMKSAADHTKDWYHDHGVYVEWTFDERGVHIRLSHGGGVSRVGASLAVQWHQLEHGWQGMLVATADSCLQLIQMEIEKQKAPTVK